MANIFRNIAFLNISFGVCVAYMYKTSEVIVWIKGGQCPAGLVEIMSVR